MEELLVLLLQAVFEGLIEIFSYVPWDVHVDKRSENCPRWLYVVLAAILGAFIGGLSIWLFPFTAIPFGWARIANLALAPFVSATISRWRALKRSKMNPEIEPNLHWWSAYFFTFGLVLIRFTYAVRP